VIIAPSFADIFYNNCFKNGILPIILDEKTVDEMFHAIEQNPGYKLVVDLDEQVITVPDGSRLQFDVDGFRKHCLQQGLDDIALTLQHVDDIRAYEKKRSGLTPWLFADIS
ncbi:MAG: 3-isopropylmalate dehydratase small subunit, partial [Arenicellales bacterium]